MTKKISLLTVVMAVATVTALAGGPTRTQMPLNGEWRFALDPNATMDATSSMSETITLPGTTDTNGKGNVPQNTQETTHLTRMHSYVGRAWYSREVVIPKQWKGGVVEMVFERTKPSVVYVDGQKAGESDNICTPQCFNLTSWLTPGRHTITVMVDNGESVPPQLLSNSHAYTEDTQTNWNGIIGEMYLEVKPKTCIADIQLSPDPISGSVDVCVTANGTKGKPVKLKLEAISSNNGKTSTMEGKFAAGADGCYHITMPLDKPERWDEFSPNRFTMRVTLNGTDFLSKEFGFVDFSIKDHHFTANGRELYLRGKHDACVFPLNAHVPMTIGEWKTYLGKCSEYGINHIRFHSWCPPDAAFTAADELGIYMQPELPFWGDFNKDDERLMTFLHKEGENIINTYGHHPSFVMFALGNELWGSIEKMEEFVADFRAMAPRKLFTFGSNYYLGYQGVKPGMDYFTTCRVGGEAWGEFNTHTRGSFSFADTYDGGIINHFAPNTTINFKDACALSTVPVISHETAQFQTYPDYDQIRKYTGVLYPYNMQVFYKRLVQAGMADQAMDFHMASGQWSLQLYKADVEMDLRTPNMAGFQLLDLQDYPGQGSAYVGVLDAFMDEKPFMKHCNGKAQWQSFCSRFVPMAEMDKMCFSNDEELKANVLLANYGSGEGQESWDNGVMEWQLTTGNKVIQKGTVAIPSGKRGLMQLEHITANLGGIEVPTRCELALAVCYNRQSGKQYTNSYPLWVYPANGNLEEQKKGIVITREMTDDIAAKLEKGAMVLFMPDTTYFKDNVVGGLFQTDYWNYRMFKTISENNHHPVSPGTMGILTNPQHPALALFPTEMHTSWQWFPVIKASSPMILDNLPADYRPIVQVIDNIERNHRLGLVFEFAVGKGKLLICMSDLEKASSRIEGRQFYISLLNYMHSDTFKPATQYSCSQLMQLLHKPVQERQLEELNNISPY